MPIKADEKSSSGSTDNISVLSANDLVITLRIFSSSSLKVKIKSFPIFLPSFYAATLIIFPILPANFYDEAILSRFKETEEEACMIIGRSIAHIDQRMGNRVGDMFVFSRIRALAQAGKIQIVRDAPTYRDMTIRKIGA